MKKFRALTAILLAFVLIAGLSVSSCSKKEDTKKAVAKLRELAQKDLDLALLEAMKNTSGYLKGGNQSMHPDSVAAIRTLEKKIGGKTDET